MSILREKIEDIIDKAAPNIGPVEVASQAKPEFGHFTTNVAMQVAANRVSGNPREAAEEIVRGIKKRAPEGFFEKVEIAGPGFINFWVSDGEMQSAFAKIKKAQKRYGEKKRPFPERIIVEYLSLNIAKPPNAGHLRNAFLGDALANIYDTLGYRSIRWNYLGDWGTQFGAIIAAWKKWGDEDRLEEDPLEESLSLYVRFNKEVEKDPEARGEASAEFRKLEKGDRENREIWKKFKEESIRYTESFMARLGIKFHINIGESFYEGEMEGLVRDLLRQGVAERSEGAVIVPLEKYGLPPALIQKSDGASLYLTRDIALLKHRVREYRPKKILYVIGNEQSLQMEQLFAVADILGIAKDVDLAHVKYGLLLGEDGKKFSTRKGSIVRAEDVVGEAARRAEQTVEEKNPSLSGDEKKLVSETVALGALKYFMLKDARTSDIVFDWKRVLDLAGQSGPYIQYTYVRLASIFTKAKEEGIKYGWKKKYKKELSGEKEFALARKLFEFPDTVERAARELSPNVLALYLYELAGAANRFYEANLILKDENQDRRNARLGLTDMTMSVLERGMNMLGIKVLLRM